jgi:hypothetical protein
MARKPIELEIVRRLTPRQRIWASVRKLRIFTLVELQDAVQPVAPFKTLEFYVYALVKAGYVAAVAAQTSTDQRFDEVQYKLIKDALEAPRLGRYGDKVTQGAATLAMWRAMQVLREFDWHEVQRAASLPSLVIRPQTAATYVYALNHAGYFRTIRRSKPGTAARFRLIKNTGPLAPAITRSKSVFDRNTCEFASHETKEELVQC